MLKIETHVDFDLMDQVKKEINDAMQIAITKAVMDTKLLSDDAVPVDTGNLKNSVQPDLSNLKNLVGEVGTDVDYANAVEFGSAKKPARPYLIPAFEKISQSFEQVCAAIINSKIKGK